MSLPRTGQGTKQTALLASTGFVMGTVEIRQAVVSARENNKGGGEGRPEVAILDRRAAEKVASNGTIIFIKIFQWKVY